MNWIYCDVCRDFGPTIEPTIGFFLRTMASVCDEVCVGSKISQHTKQSIERIWCWKMMNRITYII